MPVLPHEEKTKLLINREISWLQFNERVLQETMDKTNPLIERIKFIGIYSNNRDEFFRVRVATLRRMIKIQERQPVPDLFYQEVLTEVLKVVSRQEKTFTKAYKDIVKELAGINIHIINEKHLNLSQAQFVKKYYKEKVRSNLFPLMLDNFQSLNAIQDAVIYLLVHLRDSQGHLPEDAALIQLPTDVNDRFVILPSDDGHTSIMFLDDIIRYNLGDIFAVFGYDHLDAYTIKITRDSELDIDNDVLKSFLELMRESVKKRKAGEAIRFIYDGNMPDPLLRRILKKFEISRSDALRRGGRYHNFKDFMSFPKIGPPSAFYPTAPAVTHKDLQGYRNMFDAIKRKDIMLNFPYHSFDTIVDLLREASIDPHVRSIKMTFYRTARNSAAMNALINAARNGKFVTVFMEIQARFDEEANIYWTQRLQEEGVKVIQTLPGYKVHAKLILIRRREGSEENAFYANISTGNYNEATATVFCDFSLLTRNPKICEDVYNVFELLESKFIIPTFHALKVAPFGLREFFLEKLDTEINNAREGKEAWAIIKVNSMVDKRLAMKLYEASQAGVRIDLINRGICVIKPGVPNFSENIHAFSIVDRYLEHSRVYIFCNGGDTQFFTSSADWMPRNFDHRVEVVCPILDAEIRQELMDVMMIQIRDNVKSRFLGPGNLNHYRKMPGEKKHRAQFEIYDYYFARHLSGQ
jgi:polyphosphate kinase